MYNLQENELHKKLLIVYKKLSEIYIYVHTYKKLL